MIKIAHRGNIYGPSTMENHPDHILSAINLGYDVEIDVWNIDNLYYLGHDKPKFLIDFNFLESISNNAWVHCKNLSALTKLSMINNINCFWHQQDDHTLTSMGYVWTYPGKSCEERSILVYLGMPNKDILSKNFYGICSDFVGNF